MQKQILYTKKGKENKLKRKKENILKKHSYKMKINIRVLPRLTV